jgi:hypothetical protein
LRPGFGAVAAGHQEEMPDLLVLTASMTAPATPMTALRAKPTMTVPLSVSSSKPFMAKALSITGEILVGAMWVTPGQPTSPVVKMLS